MSRRSVMVASAPDRPLSPVQDDGFNIAASALVARRLDLVTRDMQGYAKHKVFSIVLHVYGFVRPSTGDGVWFLADGVGAVLFSRILAAFAREVGAGVDKRILMVLDGAGWHGAGAVEIPAGVTLEFLPRYSPELQPAERLWPLTNEAVANTHFADLQAVDQALDDRCCALANEPSRLKAVTWFHWWPQFA